MAMAGPSVGSEVRGCLEHGGEGTLARWRSGWGPPGKRPRWVGVKYIAGQVMKSWARIEDQRVDLLRLIHPGLGVFWSDQDGDHQSRAWMGGCHVPRLSGDRHPLEGSHRNSPLPFCLKEICHIVADEHTLCIYCISLSNV